MCPRRLGPVPGCGVPAPGETRPRAVLLPAAAPRAPPHRPPRRPRRRECPPPRRSGPFAASRPAAGSPRRRRPHTAILRAGAARRGRRGVRGRNRGGADAAAPRPLPGRVHSAARKGETKKRGRSLARGGRALSPLRDDERGRLLLTPDGAFDSPHLFPLHHPLLPDSLHPPVPLATAGDLIGVVSRAQSEVTAVAMGTQGHQGVRAPQGTEVVVLFEGNREKNWENSLNQAKDCERAAMRTGAPERSGKRDAEVEGQVVVTWAGSGIPNLQATALQPEISHQTGSDSSEPRSRSTSATNSLAPWTDPHSPVLPPVNCLPAS